MGVLSAAVIAWAQGQIDGIPADKFKGNSEGMTWRWSGAPMPLVGLAGMSVSDGKKDAGAPLLLTGGALPARGGEPLLLTTPAKPKTIVAGPQFGSAFVVTDGERIYSGLPVAPGGADAPLLVFHDGLPPSATDLTILQADPALIRTPAEPDPAALMCFTPGTLIETAEGPVAIEDLGPGDRVMTRDSGAKEVVWIGHRRMSGARLFALPKERPVRIRAGALGDGYPEPDLLVSPDHRILKKSPEAAALWGEPEVLIRAADLCGTPGVSVDHELTGTHYVHLMLDSHQVISANGAPVETFHPGFAGFGAMTQAAKKSLLETRPDLARNPHLFGPPVRRMLRLAEAQILAHAETTGRG
ncbi:hemolysin-type calcium-binding protein [Rhodobacterales bacterium HKCCE3408]|nr:hemolysin-type calcium-binding protein [Rhodobacterales bacterium HKCCE3408]